MDPLKIVVFVIAFLLLLLVGRLLSASSEVHVSQLPVPEPGVGPVGESFALSPPGLDQNKTQVLTGAEVGLPFSLPPVVEDDKGKFNRPYYLNYYFKQTDLVRGPADSTRFYDEFFLVFEDPASHHTWETRYVVATPSGLQDIMSREHFVSIYLDDPVVIVSQWNLTAILRAVIDESMKSFGEIKEEL